MSQGPERGILKRTAPADSGEELRLEEKIRSHLTSSGKREELKQLLTARLTECGWRDDIKQRCREYVARSGSLQSVTTEEIVRAVRPAGRAAVPDSVKAELLAEIKKAITGI
ncbi:hypothetical protein GPECTOR_8g17 [Gonium pectorale]|uniref:Transcription and mRNA export factor ENY2 n=1 Tax=Gonium pectorale TaxID=33097 RepID=A0A150GSJ5_GONPE|nr:hypothetical protein GPECTOR_8g17 [Gonium pectorale]|eukprot:KXZ52781.1 hypothetical protein GPECTOR_8g17 [Gonium pectorale]